MKLKNLLFIAGLVGSISLVALSCGGGQKAAEPAPAPAAKQVQQGEKPTEEVAAREEAKAQLVELESALKEAEKELASKEKMMGNAKTQLNKLEDRDVELKDAESGELETLSAEKNRLIALLAGYREKITAELEEVGEKVQLASEGITSAEEEFQKMPVFGDASTTKEVLLYLFGFKWLWGFYNGYQATFFTYNPQHSLSLRNKLAETQERMLAVQELLSSAVKVQSSQGVYSDIAAAQEKVNEALAFLATNKVAVHSYTIRHTAKALEHQKALLETITQFIPLNQRMLEQTTEGITHIGMSREERASKIESIKRTIKHLDASIKALLADIRAKKVTVEEARREFIEKFA